MSSSADARLTPGQARAATPGTHLAVTANAGSGKTMVLVERYLAFTIGEGVDAREVVALTFTDKAASELKRKIASRVTDLLARERDPVRHARCERVRQQLPGAFIGTIHSFCARLLREHPVEAGVDASFVVLEGLDQRIMLQETVRETFHDLLRGPAEDSVRTQVFDLVRSLGTHRSVQIVSSLVERREQLVRWNDAHGPYAGTDEEVLDAWRSRIGRFVAHEIEAPSFREALERVAARAAGKHASAVGNLLGVITSRGALGERARALREFVHLAVRADGGLYSSYAGGASTDGLLDRALGMLHQWRADLAPLLDAVLDTSHDSSHRRLLGLTRVLLMVGAEVMLRYDRKKLEGGRLDFEDLQLRTRALLMQEGVRRQLSARFRTIMVDEYQDTNRLQYEILLPLLDGLRRGNLFVVGDPKQSIYGFRNADVSIFHATRADIVRASGPEADLVLGESFRMLRDLAAFTNLVFTRLMGDEVSQGGASYEVGYEPLVRARANGEPGRVELMFRGDARDEVPEADLIARRLLRLVRDRHRVYSPGESPREVRFRDIAILLRSRTILPDVEHSLLTHGVPFVVTGGVGYFQTQDILDFYNYLAFLADQSDDTALAGTLRSGFFCVSDAELLDAAALRGREPFWASLRRVAADGELPVSVRRAVARLEEDCALAMTVTVPDLIARIVERTHYVAKASASPRGEQAIANLEKLRRMARAFDAQGLVNLYDFVLRLRQLIEEEHEEGQGPVDSLGDAVQIMTIHAAKGLEFPVVFVPQLHRMFQYDREPFVDDELGVGFSFGEEEEAVPPLTVLVREVGRRKTRAEEKRILYVAVTRARDLLVLSGNVPDGRQAAGAMAWLMESLAFGVRPPAGPVEVRTSTGILERAGEEYASRLEAHTLTLHVVYPEIVSGLAPPARGTEVTGAQPLMLPESIPARGRGEIFSATRIRTYLECPARYYFRYVIGYPEADGMRASEEADELVERDLPAGLFGRIFHSVMQRIDSTGPDPDRILEACRREAALESPAGTHDLERLARHVCDHVLRVIASTFWRTHAPGSDVRTEFTISSPLGSHFIVGTLDRMFRSSDGMLTLLDYKTDAVTPEGLAGRAAHYMVQVRFYGLLAARYVNAPSVRTVLLFTAVPEQPVLEVLGEEQLASVERDIARAIERIERGDFTPPEKACPVCTFPPGFCRRVLFTGQRIAAVS